MAEHTSSKVVWEENSIMVTNGTETWSPNKLTCKLIAFFVREFLSFYIAEDVAPYERRETHEDDSELRRYQVEVDGLRG